MIKPQPKFTDKQATQILVIPKHRVKHLLKEKRYQSKPEKLEEIKRLIEQGKGKFRFRGCMEENPSFKQLIPYVLVENEEGKLLSYSRSNKGGESKLYGSKSIGFGGHIDYTPSLEDKDIIFSNLKRELKEELNLDVIETDIIPLGIIYLEQSKVDTVHLGLVYKTIIKDFDINQGETDILKNRQWINPLVEDVRKYESWSKAIIRELKNENTTL